MKINRYGDQTNEEFVRTMNGLESENTYEYYESTDKNIQQQQQEIFFKKPEDFKIPYSVDWRTKGINIFELFIINLVNRLIK